ncbi:MAG: FAD-dependent oxidoreductase, partial [Xanthobacteraceae bacterium]
MSVDLVISRASRPRVKKRAAAVFPLVDTRARSLDVTAVREIVERSLKASSDDSAAKAVRRELQTIDRECHFSSDALLLFQDLLARLGISTHRPIQLPLNDVPFWHRTPHPLANFQSTDRLPASADVVIIGAGLTGAAAAYRLRNSGRRVVLIDRGDPAGDASG